MDQKNTIYVKLCNDIYRCIGKEHPDFKSQVNCIQSNISEKTCEIAHSILDDIYRKNILNEMLSIVPLSNGMFSFVWKRDDENEVIVSMNLPESYVNGKLTYTFDFKEWRSSHSKWIGGVDDVSEIERVIKLFLSQNDGSKFESIGIM